MSFHARLSDPDTSHEAIPKNISVQAIKILRAYGAGGSLLDVEAYQSAGFGPTACDGQRCSDLRKSGYIERTGEKARTPSGKSGYLCKITPAGVAYLQRQGAL